MNSLLAVSILSAAALSNQGGVPKSEVFPIETLPAEERVLAEKWLLNMLDREGLYTLIGGLKPMSSGWMSVDTQKGLAGLEVDQAQRVVRQLRVGSLIQASVLPFSRTFNGKRTLEGHVFHTGSFGRAISERQRFFSQFGITPNMPPGEAVMAFESDGTSERFRAYGYFFGYPDYAVEFFAQAADTQKNDPEKKLVPRRFLSIPTFKLPTNGFVYAVPLDHTERDEDLRLRKSAEPILAEYKRRRSLWIKADGTGASALLRDWMCESDSNCSPEIALAKAERKESEGT